MRRSITILMAWDVVLNAGGLILALFSERPSAGVAGRRVPDRRLAQNAGRSAVSHPISGVCSYTPSDAQGPGRQ